MQDFFFLSLNIQLPLPYFFLLPKRIKKYHTTFSFRRKITVWYLYYALKRQTGKPTPILIHIY